MTAGGGVDQKLTDDRTLYIIAEAILSAVVDGCDDIRDVDEAWEAYIEFRGPEEREFLQSIRHSKHSVFFYMTHEISDRIQKEVGFSYWVRDWREMNQNLFSALKLEKITMFIILVLIIVVAAFNIIGTLILVVMEKGREIAILKAMGATRRNIGRIFMLEGLLIGLGGTALGLGLGLGLCYILANYQFVELPASVYYVTTLPVKVQILDILAICLAAVAVSFLATVYPARRASLLNPVEILRYE